MFFSKAPIHHISGDRYAIGLGEQERSLLVALADELGGLLESPDGPGLHRSFPPAYRGVDNVRHAEEFRLLMTDELAGRHRDALATLTASAQAIELNAEELNAWMRALNQLRLTLATRLGVTKDGDVDLSGVEGAVYEFLTDIQQQVVEALSGS